MATVEHGYELEARVHRESDTRHLDAPILSLDLTRELAALRKMDGAPGGHRAKTISKYPDLRVVLIDLEAGARVDTHKAPGRVSIHALEGHVSVQIDGQTVDLRAGNILQLAPELHHALHAVVRSAVLVTILWPARE